MTASPVGIEPVVNRNTELAWNPSRAIHSGEYPNTPNASYALEDQGCALYGGSLYCVGGDNLDDDFRL